METRVLKPGDKVAATLDHKGSQFRVPAIIESIKVNGSWWHQVKVEDGPLRGFHTVSSKNLRPLKEEYAKAYAQYCELTQKQKLEATQREAKKLQEAQAQQELVDFFNSVFGIQSGDSNERNPFTNSYGSRITMTLKTALILKSIVLNSMREELA